MEFSDVSGVLFPLHAAYYIVTFNGYYPNATIFRSFFSLSLLCFGENIVTSAVLGENSAPDMGLWFLVHSGIFMLFYSLNTETRRKIVESKRLQLIVFGHEAAYKGIALGNVLFRLKEYRMDALLSLGMWKFASSSVFQALDAAASQDRTFKRFGLKSVLSNLVLGAGLSLVFAALQSPIFTQTLLQRLIGYLIVGVVLMPKCLMDRKCFSKGLMQDKIK